MNRAKENRVSQNSNRSPPILRQSRIKHASKKNFLHNRRRNQSRQSNGKQLKNRRRLPQQLHHPLHLRLPSRPFLNEEGRRLRQLISPKPTHNCRQNHRRRQQRPLSPPNPKTFPPTQALFPQKPRRKKQQTAVKKQPMEIPRKEILLVKPQKPKQPSHRERREKNKIRAYRKTNERF